MFEQLDRSTNVIIESNYGLIHFLNQDEYIGIFVKRVDEDNIININWPRFIKKDE